MSRVVLAIGAHFDDVEIGMGGTIIQHVEAGDDVYIAVTSADEHRTGSQSLRLSEQHASLNILGLHKTRLYTSTCNRNVSDVVERLDNIHPDIVYVPYWKDTHQDHVRCSRIGQAVGRKRNIDVFFYDSGSTYEFSPTMFVKIDFDKKQQLLDCFPSQIKNGSVVHLKYKRRDAYTASLISDDENVYAEGFVVRRMQHIINNGGGCETKGGACACKTKGKSG